MICAQDKKFPKVREEIQNLADKLGVDYGTAKVIYESNNGYGLDKAPNGAESKLYKTLLEHYGDEQRALIAKARTHLAPFKNWFGDWTSEDTTNVSKVVDENSEPLVVYHNSPFVFEIFDMNHPSRISKHINEPFGHIGTKETANKIKGTQYLLFANIKKSSVFRHFSFVPLSSIHLKK